MFVDCINPFLQDILYVIFLNSTMNTVLENNLQTVSSRGFANVAVQMILIGFVQEEKKLLNINPRDSLFIIQTWNFKFDFLLLQDKFLPLLDLFQKESIKVEVCKSIMDVFTHSNIQQEPTNDPVIINALMFICRVMHDSVK
jgi:hypothetical protein